MQELNMTRARDDPESASKFEAFFVAEYPRLVRALYLLTGDGVEAEDLAQEALTRVFGAAPRRVRQRGRIGGNGE